MYTLISKGISYFTSFMDGHYIATEIVTCQAKNMLFIATI